MGLYSTSNFSNSAAQWLPIDTVVTADGRVARLKVTGELDDCTADVLGSAVAQALDLPAVELIELDVAALAFCDSTGIACLLACGIAAHDAGSRLVLVNPTPLVTRVLDITGVLDLLGVTPQSSRASQPVDRNRSHQSRSAGEQSTE